MTWRNTRDDSFAFLKGGQPVLSYDCQHALAMAYATSMTAFAEREAAARQLEEGKLFVELLHHRLTRAQGKMVSS